MFKCSCRLFVSQEPSLPLLVVARQKHHARSTEHAPPNDQPDDGRAKVTLEHLSAAMSGPVSEGDAGACLPCVSGRGRREHRGGSRSGRQRGERGSEPAFSPDHGSAGADG